MKKPVRVSWVELVERVLIRLAFVAAVVVIAAQALLAGGYPKQAAAPVLSPEPVQSSKNSAGILQTPVVTLQLKSYSSLPLAQVLVNGETRGKFHDRYVTVFVQEGDILEVDGTRYNKPFEIEVLDVSRSLASPVTGKKIKVEGNKGLVGKVCLYGGMI